MASREKANLTGLQILRAVAALLVVCHHSLKESRPLFEHGIPAPLVVMGASGVDIFFVISGFIMYYTNHNRFGRANVSGDFFIRRIIRIVPMYWICTLAIVFLHFTGLYRHMQITRESVALSLLFLPTPNVVIGFGWTLNYEMYFYAVLALWLLIGTRRSGILGPLFSIPLIVIICQFLPPSEASYLGNPTVLEFCFGFAVAAAYTRGYIPDGLGRAALLVGIAGIVLGAFGPRIGGDQGGTAGLDPNIRFLLWGVPAVALLVFALSIRPPETYLGKSIVAMGDASYSIYLTQTFVIISYARILKTNVLLDVPRPICILIPVVVSVLVGLASYHIIERPMNEHLKTWWKASRSPVGVAARNREQLDAR
ncbi:acyltransferase [Acidisphaera sp. S103]|uniref:acyltransferase family protein n=1 Tax=Acidisphaera sp. S103 TaxID=1747223 RepID=UPI00131BDB22|nr:acyltransferase [Acidisphaera sp. S103]